MWKVFQQSWIGCLSLYKGYRVYSLAKERWIVFISEIELRQGQIQHVIKLYFKISKRWDGFSINIIIFKFT